MPMPSGTPVPATLSIGAAVLRYDAAGKTILRNVAVDVLGQECYSLDASGDGGRIPFGITSTLRVSDIELGPKMAEVILSDRQGVEVVVIDTCDQGENPCSVSIALYPSIQPESPIDLEAYSFCIAFQAEDTRSVRIRVKGETFMPFRKGELVSPVDWDQVIANNGNLSGILSLLPVEYHITHRDGPLDQTHPFDHPHDGDVFTLVNADSGQESIGQPLPMPIPAYDVLSPYKARVVKIYDNRTPDRQDGTVNLTIALYVGQDISGRHIYLESVHNNAILVEEGQTVEQGEKIGQLNILYGVGSAAQVIFHFSFNDTERGWDVKWEDYPHYIDPKPAFLRLFFDQYVVQRGRPALLVYSGPEQQKLSQGIPDSRKGDKTKTELHARSLAELVSAGYRVVEADESRGLIVSPQGKEVPFGYFDYRAIVFTP